MQRIKIQPSKIAEWHSLIVEAQNKCGLQFDDHIVSYIILTLDEFTTDCKIASIVIAIEMLNNINLSNTHSVRAIRSVGDQCLLLSGLFPERAIKKNVSVEYFIGMGQQAYDLLASTSYQILRDSKLFEKLSLSFVDITDVLSTMRNLNN